MLLTDSTRMTHTTSASFVVIVILISNVTLCEFVDSFRTSAVSAVSLGQNVKMVVKYCLYSGKICYLYVLTSLDFKSIPHVP